MATTQEECEIVECWEDIDDSEVLDKTFLSKEDTSVVKSSNGPIVIEEDSIRTQYTPPEPSVKILKRPSRRLGDSDNSDILVNGEFKCSRHPVKTLQQREMEYAEARLRILGEAKSPEDEIDERLSRLNFNPSTVTLLRPTDLVNIIRLPRGPDGTKGFTLKR